MNMSGLRISSSSRHSWIPASFRSNAALRHKRVALFFLCVSGEWNNPRVDFERRHNMCFNPPSGSLQRVGYHILLAAEHVGEVRNRKTRSGRFKLARKVQSADFWNTPCELNLQNKSMNTSHATTQTVHHRIVHKSPASSLAAAQRCRNRGDIGTEASPSSCQSSEAGVCQSLTTVNNFKSCDYNTPALRMPAKRCQHHGCHSLPSHLLQTVVQYHVVISCK